MIRWTRLLVFAGTFAISGCTQPSLIQRAKRIHREAPLVDGHNDLPWQLRGRGAGDPGQMDFGRPLPAVHTDVPRLVGIEGGHAIDDSLPLLRQFYALGARYMTLTHNETINWADAAAAEPRHGGLSDFGEAVVREMNRLGMMVDVSHVSDETMRDALRVSEAPVIFSHSAARALAGDQPRNVPDDMLRLVRDNGVVVMINFYSGYLLPEPPGRESAQSVRRRLREQHPGSDEARRAAWRQWRRDNPVPRGDVSTVADHVDHVVRRAGIDHVGLGSDFDGVSTLPEGLEDVSCYPALTVELLRRGYSDADVKQVIGGNVLRVMRGCASPPAAA